MALVLLMLMPMLIWQRKALKALQNYDVGLKYT